MGSYPTMPRKLQQTVSIHNNGIVWHTPNKYLFLKSVLHLCCRLLYAQKGPEGSSPVRWEQYPLPSVALLITHCTGQVWSGQSVSQAFNKWPLGMCYGWLPISFQYATIATGEWTQGRLNGQAWVCTQLTSLPRGNNYCQTTLTKLTTRRLVR